MAMDKDMAYRFSYKLRLPSGGFDSIAFMLKYFIPGDPRPDRLWIQPSAELPGKNTEYLAGLFLGKALSDRVVYDSNHSLFNLEFKMAY
jgi:hypothetical protein